MKSILMSIKPKWIEKIASGEKTVEVRKKVPKCGTPFKVYIYETKAQYVSYQKGALTKFGYGKGKVVGEFVCDAVIDFISSVAGVAVCKIEKGKVCFLDNPIRVIKETCLSPSEIKGYLGNNDGYGLHISDLKIYDKPKELSEFIQMCSGLCADPAKGYICPSYYKEKFLIGCGHKKIVTRPPQSWQYVEEQGVQE